MGVERRCGGQPGGAAFLITRGGSRIGRRIGVLRFSYQMYYSLDALGAPGQLGLKACLRPTWKGKEAMLAELKAQVTGIRACKP